MPAPRLVLMPSAEPVGCKIGPVAGKGSERVVAGVRFVVGGGDEG